MARSKNKKNTRGRTTAPARKTPRKQTKAVASPKGSGKRGAGDVPEPAVQPARVVERAPCHFCKKDCDKNDMFCFGCKTVICGESDVSMGEYGRGHSPEDHRKEPEPVTW